MPWKSPSRLKSDEQWAVAPCDRFAVTLLPIESGLSGKRYWLTLAFHFSRET